MLLLWQWLAATTFPLHSKIAKNDFTPDITLLKPLKGCDPETKASLESWVRQTYAGNVQILFGVASPDDPVCEVVRALISENPKAGVELVVCSELFGPNAKVSSLIQLEKMAKHEIVVVSDADVRVPENFLKTFVQPLGEKKIGLVNCFYKFANPQNGAMHWEAMAVNADFWSQVLQSKMLKPIDFALGAVMATRRENLKEIGGFAALVDFLADDYQLGNRIAKTGKEIALSPIVVECWERPMNFKEVWAHQLRWARTIRVCQPIPFFFSILSNATIWPLLLFLWLVLGGVSLKLAILPILIFLSARIFIALHLQEKLTQTLEHYAWFWLVPVKDLLGVAIWALAFIGNEVQWRGVRYKVSKGGKLRVAG